MHHRDNTLSPSTQYQARTTETINVLQLSTKQYTTQTTQVLQLSTKHTPQRQHRSFNSVPTTHHRDNTGPSTQYQARTTETIHVLQLSTKHTPQRQHKSSNSLPRYTETTQGLQLSTKHHRDNTGSSSQ